MVTTACVDCYVEVTSVLFSACETRVNALRGT